MASFFGQMQNKWNLAKAMAKTIKVNKRGNLASLLDQGILIVIAVVIFVVGAVIIQTIGNDQTAGTAARNASNQGLTFITNVTNQFGLLGTIVIFGIIIAAVVGYLAFGRGRTGGGL